MSIHYNDPKLCITCMECILNRHIRWFIFKNFKCRLCVFIRRYRYTHTRDRFKEYAEKFNIKV